MAYRILRPLFGARRLLRPAAMPARHLWALAGVLGVVLGYGTLTLRAREKFYSDERPKAKLAISVLQGNIPQEEKWDARIKGIIFEKYKRLTLMGAMEKADLVVWPETSFPGYIEDEPVMAAQLRGVVRQSRTSVLVGAPTIGDLEKELKFYNSAVLYGANGEEVQRYHKEHLVPFGE
jgi:apolipoprotein N-acyltransferase